MAQNKSAKGEKASKAALPKKAATKTLIKRVKKAEVKTVKSAAKEHSMQIVGSGIDFCPKCGAIMVPVKKDSSVFLQCRLCNKKIKKNIKIMKFVEKLKNREGVVVLEKDETIMPQTERLCEKCGNKRAYWWMQPTKDDDEAPTQFFRCTKCKHVWREDK